MSKLQRLNDLEQFQLFRLVTDKSQIRLTESELTKFLKQRAVRAKSLTNRLRKDGASAFRAKMEGLATMREPPKAVVGDAAGQKRMTPAQWAEVWRKAA